MKYDHNNPLSDEELDKLAEKDFDLFLDYLDSKTAYLKQFTKPLSSYHTKRFTALTRQLNTPLIQIFLRSSQMLP